MFQDKIASLSFANEMKSLIIKYINSDSCNYKYNGPGKDNNTPFCILNLFLHLLFPDIKEDSCVLLQCDFFDRIFIGTWMSFILSDDNNVESSVILENVVTQLESQDGFNTKVLQISFY